jgi:thiaminase (transcriptional activator TenA)
VDIFDRLRNECAADWSSYVDHAFVQKLGDASLPEAAFRTYLVQDYLFLIQFARAYALAVYKSRTLADMRAAHAGVAAILDVEMDLHVRLCGRWGLTPAELEAAPELQATVAYTRYVLDCGLSGDLLDLHVALTPCVIGYAEIAKTLVANIKQPLTNHPYREWIGEYAGDAYRQIAQNAREQLVRLAAKSMTAERFPELCGIFAKASRLEADFWQMALDNPA